MDAVIARRCISPQRSFARKVPGEMSAAERLIVTNNKLTKPVRLLLEAGSITTKGFSGVMFMAEWSVDPARQSDGK